MGSLLEDFRSKNKQKADASLDEYNAACRTCPPVSQLLLDHLDMMFSRKDVHHTDPTMSQQLIIQAGIDKVIKHLRRQNDRQEKEAREARTK